MSESQEPTGLEPTVLAFVVCDHVHIDPLTSRFTVLGTFYEIESQTFPENYPKMAVYAALSDGRGRVPITIRLIDVDEEHEPLWSATEYVNFEDPHRVRELAFEAIETPIEGPGVLRLQLLAAGITIMERSIVVLHWSEEE